jgi:hypothetical protein
MFPNIDLMDKDPFDEGGIVRRRRSKRGCKLNPKYLGWAGKWKKTVACNMKCEQWTRHVKNNAEMDRVVAVESSTCRSGMGPQ